MIILLMGVSGSGKTTIGNKLSDALEWDFIDGDGLHPQANIDKMSQGIALTDSDRDPWLETVRAVVEHGIEHKKNFVLACSALKASYRERLKQGSDEVKIVYLKASEAVLRERMEQRQGHFMPSSLLESQLATLEEPRDAVVVNVDQDVDQVVAEIRGRVEV